MQRIPLDTGTSLNTVLAPDTHYVRQKLTLFKLANLFSPELGRHIPFYKVPISEKLAEKIEERGESFLVINPQIIDEAGFTVMDFKRKRLVGFKDEANLRACYGHGLREHLGKTGVAYNMSLVEVILDGKVSGLGFIDTGSFLTEFYGPQISTENAEPSQELSSYLVNGDFIVPQVSPNHTIKIGDKIKILDLVSVAANKPTQYTDGSVSRDNGSIATIGYDALQGSVLIFPPKSAGYWELIF